MYQICLIQIALLIIIVALHFKSRGAEKIKLSSQTTYNFQSLRNETLIIADYEYEKASRFAMLDIKLQLNDDSILYQFWVFDWMNFNELYKGDLCVFSRILFQP